jgi:hypothetical protein
MDHVITGGMRAISGLHHVACSCGEFSVSGSAAFVRDSAAEHERWALEEPQPPPPAEPDAAALRAALLAFEAWCWVAVRIEEGEPVARIEDWPDTEQRVETFLAARAGGAAARGRARRWMSS